MIYCWPKQHLVPRPKVLSAFFRIPGVIHRSGSKRLGLGYIWVISSIVIPTGIPARMRHLRTPAPDLVPPEPGVKVVNIIDDIAHDMHRYLEACAAYGNNVIFSF